MQDLLFALRDRLPLKRSPPLADVHPYSVLSTRTAISRICFGPRDDSDSYYVTTNTLRSIRTSYFLPTSFAASRTTRYIFRWYEYREASGGELTVCIF
jgi:hypothetical protein